MDFRGLMGGIVVNDEVKLAFPIQRGTRRRYVPERPRIPGAGDAGGIDPRLARWPRRKRQTKTKFRDAHNHGSDARADRDAGAKWVGCAPGLESGSSHRHKAQWLYRADSDTAPQYRAPSPQTSGRHST